MSASGPRGKTIRAGHDFTVWLHQTFRAFPYGGGQAVTGIDLIHLLIRSVPCVSTT